MQVPLINLMFLFGWLSFYLVPVVFGLIGSRYMGLVANFLMMWAAFVAYVTAANFAIFGNSIQFNSCYSPLHRRVPCCRCSFSCWSPKVAERRKMERATRISRHSYRGHPVEGCPISPPTRGLLGKAKACRSAALRRALFSSRGNATRLCRGVRQLHRLLMHLLSQFFQQIARWKSHPLLRSVSSGTS